MVAGRDARARARCREQSATYRSRVALALSTAARGGPAEPARDPRLHLAIEKPAVLPAQNPVVLVGPDDEAAGKLLALQRGPELERVVHRHAEIALADRYQHRRVQIRRPPHRALRAPKRMIFPRRPTDVALAVVVEIAGRPLRLEVPLAGVADERAIARRRDGQPVREMPAVAGAAGHLSGRVDEPEALDRRIGGLVDVVGRPFERIELYVLRKLLAVAGRS